MKAIQPKKTYILVHGAWHNNFCWSRLAPKIEKMGHKVIAPNLPGHGSNIEDFKKINLSDYVRTIKNFVVSNKERVVLVGHSMAGIVISQVAEDIPQKKSVLWPILAVLSLIKMDV